MIAGTLALSCHNFFLGHPPGAAAPPPAAGAPLGDPREQRAPGAARLRPGDPLLGALDAGAGLLRAAHGLDHHHFEGQGVGDGDGWDGWMGVEDWTLLVIFWDGDVGMDGWG